jgi:hypothetical protein
MATREAKPTREDIGAAMMTWYADAIREHPEGLVTQAQAAHMLSLSRMAVSRLVSRGYLRAVYFPAPPDIEGVSIGQDDPTWLKVTGWLSLKLGDKTTYAFPQACYVSFGDVLTLWESGDAKKKCRTDWNEVMAATMHTGSRRGLEKSTLKLREIHRERQRIAQFERQEAQRG